MLTTSCRVLVRFWVGTNFRAPLARAIFAKQKPMGAKPSVRPLLLLSTEEVNMGYLIAVAVLAMMSLYALIIVHFSRQLEW